MTNTIFDFFCSALLESCRFALLCSISLKILDVLLIASVNEYDNIGFERFLSSGSCVSKSVMVALALSI